MIRALITGMSGTGKSSVLAELYARGHRVIDTDDPGWKILSPAGDEEIWDEAAMAAALKAPDPRPLFVSGCVSNQRPFYRDFSVVILLTAPLQVLLDRVAARTTNHFGKSPEQRARIIADYEAFMPLLRSGADVEIDATLPLARMADLVEQAAFSGRGDKQECVLTLEDIKARLTDPPVMAVLAAAVYDPTPERLLARARAWQRAPGVFALGARQDGPWLGILVALPGPEGTEILSLAVAQTHRRRNVGRALVEALLKRQGAPLWAETDDDAVGFYRRCGFSVERVWEKYPGTLRYLCRYGKAPGDAGAQ